MKYSLIENGVIHTEDLTKSEAAEMLKRHQNFFPTCHWEIIPQSATKGMDHGLSLMDRQKRAFRNINRMYN